MMHSSLGNVPGFSSLTTLALPSYCFNASSRIEKSSSGVHDVLDTIRAGRSARFLGRRSGDDVKPAETRFGTPEDATFAEGIAGSSAEAPSEVRTSVNEVEYGCDAVGRNLETWDVFHMPSSRRNSLCGS
jgi:hypothetical protein